jgi:hypothetical protein
MFKKLKKYFDLHLTNELFVMILQRFLTVILIRNTFVTTNIPRHLKRLNLLIVIRVYRQWKQLKRNWVKTHY